jgi:hypothetical protein
MLTELSVGHNEAGTFTIIEYPGIGLGLGLGCS